MSRHVSDRLNKLSVDEKRMRYKCRGKYMTLEGISQWTDQCLTHSARKSKHGKKKEVIAGLYNGACIALHSCHTFHYLLSCIALFVVMHFIVCCFTLDCCHSLHCLLSYIALLYAFHCLLLYIALLAVMHLIVCCYAFNSLLLYIALLVVIHFIVYCYILHC